MPRPRKPAGYELWTWAEINAGRRFSKAERRWNHLAKKGGREQNPDGSYLAPAELQPLIAVMLVVIVAVGVLAPSGLQHSQGSELGAIAALVLGGFCVFALIYFAVMWASSAVATWMFSPPQNLSSRHPDDPGMIAVGSWLYRAAVLIVVSVPAITIHWGATARSALVDWLRRLPDWAQATLWGLACAVPPVTVMIYLLKG